MTSSRRWSAAGALLLAAALLVSGCSASQNSGNAGAGSSEPLRIRNSPFTDPLNPIATSSVYAKNILNLVFDGLIRYDAETGEPVYVSADSIVTEDNTTWTVTLKDQNFQNGEKVTAQSFVNSWNAAADPDLALVNASLFSQIAGYDDYRSGAADQLSGLKANGDNELVITLKAPDSQFVYTLGESAYYPLPSVAFENWEAFGKNPVGNGPYVLDEEWTGQQEITVSAWADYHGTEPGNVEALTFVTYENNESAWVDFQAGKLDLVGGRNSLTDVEAATTGGRLVAGKPTSWEFLRLPNYSGAYVDPRIRLALSLAINRQEIIDTIYKGAAVALTDYSYIANRGYRDDAGEGILTYDPERAKQLYQEAGGIAEPVSLYVSQTWGSPDLAEAILRQWNKVLGTGIGNIEPVTDISTPFTKKVATFPSISRTPPYTPSPGSVLGRFYVSTSPSSFGWKNPEVDRLIADATVSTSEEKALASYDSAKDVLLSDLPDIPLWGVTLPKIVSERISDIVLDPYEKVIYRSITAND